MRTGTQKLQTSGDPYLTDLTSFLMEAVIAAFMDYKKYDQDAAGDPDCQSKDIDQRIGLLPDQVSYGYLKEVLKHTA